MNKLITVCQALVIATVLSAVMLASVDTALPTVNEAVNFLTNTGNYITTIINGLKNYLQ
jgi:hypothetical protein